MDEAEVKQVPPHIVKAFVDRYGKIGERYDESDWLDLFGAWYAGWDRAMWLLAGVEQEKKECSTDTTP